jgi:ubiquinone/menaquinone biosynthesis C-methylase UbiE
MTDYAFDREQSARLEQTYLTPEIVSQRRQFLPLLGLQEGMHILDVGCGPALLVSEMAALVGPAGSVTGVDPSPEMLELGQRRCEDLIKAGTVTVLLGSANSLPVDDSKFDIAVSTQVMEYVPDIEGALCELRRALKPSGRLAILDTDWDSLVWPCDDRALAARIYSAWEDHLADPHLPQTLAQRLHTCGFTEVECHVIAIVNLDFHPGTFDWSIRRNIHSFVPGHRGVTQEDADRWVSSLEGQATLGQYFFSLNRYVFIARAA